MWPMIPLRVNGVSWTLFCRWPLTLWPRSSSQQPVVAVLLSHRRSFASVFWWSLPRSAPEMGTLGPITGLETISTWANTSCDKTNMQAASDSLNRATSRVAINNNGDNLWAAGPDPCRRNCCTCTSGWRQHKAGKECTICRTHLHLWDTATNVRGGQQTGSCTETKGNRGTPLVHESAARSDATLAGRGNAPPFKGQLFNIWIFKEETTPSSGYILKGTSFTLPPSWTCLWAAVTESKTLVPFML